MNIHNHHPSDEPKITAEIIISLLVNNLDYCTITFNPIKVIPFLKIIQFFPLDIPTLLYVNDASHHQQFSFTHTYFCAKIINENIK